MKIVDRLRSRFEEQKNDLREAYTIEPNGCWKAKSVNSEGEGMILRNGKNRYLSRVMWETIQGKIPPRFSIDRTCGDRACCSPKHLVLVERTQSPAPKLTQEIMDRFHQSFRFDPNTECWNWIGSNHPDYGTPIFIHKDGVFERPNRLSWRIHKGEIPEGAHIRRTCRNTLCCAPKHLTMWIKE